LIISNQNNILNSPIEYLKGVGPQRADLLKKELQIFTFKDLIEHFPFKHIDKTKITPILSITPQDDFVQVTGRIVKKEIIGEKRGRRLVAQLQDKSGGAIELVWFQGIPWVEKALIVGDVYRAYGKVSFFQYQAQISHPELEPANASQPEAKSFLEPVYSSTEKLKARGLGGRQLAQLTQSLFLMLSEKDFPENLPAYIIEKLNLIPRYQAICAIHFPPSQEMYQQAVNRFKFEEFFIAQLRLGLIRLERQRYSKGVVFSQVGDYFNTFYAKHLPFELTGAQKRVLKEIRKDVGSGAQMNRLLQGDVGSGKTIVALLAMLLAVDNQFQACMLAPTEILARQHFQGIKKLLGDLPLNARILTGATKTKERRKILESLANGEIQLLVGTHAIIEDTVQFKNLGLAIVDEQHRFGVAQRAKLWKKASIPPHMLVMTATPIPRTLAMTAYGDLDYSVMDELPPNRQPITTVHRQESARSQVMDFIKNEVQKGRQAYIIFPLIEESEKLDYENLMKGYENVKAYFPEPKYWISMVHGKQPLDIRETNMQRFKTNDTQIMVATTVIEVGVDVPNASVMVIESAEKFGLSQLHQLRGRVGRGAEKSYCILITGSKLSNEGSERMKIMCATNDGFKIAEKDLELRGPGDIEGTRQSGALNFKIASIANDREWLLLAQQIATRVLEKDPDLSQPIHQSLKTYLHTLKGRTAWSKIS
jgi:ATP-dependent DNA helicase RecG